MDEEEAHLVATTGKDSAHHNPAAADIVVQNEFSIVSDLLRIPFPRTITTSAAQRSKGPFSVEQLTSLSEMAANIEKMQLPSQLAAVFNNKYLQYLLVATPDATVLHRLNQWLAVRLLDGQLPSMAGHGQYEEDLSSLFFLPFFLVFCCAVFLFYYHETSSWSSVKRYVFPGGAAAGAQIASKANAVMPFSFWCCPSFCVRQKTDSSLLGTPKFAVFLRALVTFSDFFQVSTFVEPRAHGRLTLTFLWCAQETIPVVDSFIEQFLRRWNGVAYRQEILALISLMPPRPFERE